MPPDLLFASLSSTPEMDSAFSDESWLSALLKFESALASAQADMGLIPRPAAQAIGEACKANHFDASEIGSRATESGTPLLPLVDELKRALEPDVAAFVHLGATSQDAMDTAMMLLSKDATAVLLRDLAVLAGRCAALAEQSRRHVMIGRTVLQDAMPVSFGLRCANWLVGLVEAIAELHTCGERFCVQLGGPVGTMDRYGDAGIDLAKSVAVRLGLAEQIVPWHSIRIRSAQLGAALAIAAGAVAKIALDVILLSQSEIAELSEASGGRSSSMPHKHNPIHSVEARAAFAGAIAQAGVLISSVPGELERPAGSWHSEWQAVSNAFKFTHAAIAHTSNSITGLRIDSERMRANLAAAGNLTPELGAADLIIDRALTFYSEHMK